MLQQYLISFHLNNMKPNRIYSLAAVLLLYVFPLYSQSNYRLADDYTFVIRGSSNIRDWSESVDDVDGIANINMVDERHFDVEEVRILVRSSSIKSIGVEGTAMNKKTYETLKTIQYPMITFIVTAPLRSVAANGRKIRIQADGLLTIAGVSKIITLHPTIYADRQGKINVEDDVFLKMSEFDIEPPVTLFGLLRVKDSFTVHFKITLIPDMN